MYREILECQDSFFYPNEVAEQLYNFVKSGNFKQTKAILNLCAVPKPDDIADALAVAVCHAHSYNPRNPQFTGIK